jgi:fucose 4-O-acetylase-like acetyltransferase
MEPQSPLIYSLKISRICILPNDKGWDAAGRRESMASSATRPAEIEVRSSERSMLIDVVRGMAITLVVLGHTNQGVGRRGWWGVHLPFSVHLDRFIYAFHMPAFFFVSGFFLCASVDKRGPLQFTTNKLATILYPYLIWGAVSEIGPAIFRGYMLEPPPTFAQFIRAMLTGTAGWFLPTLFVTLIVAMLLRKLPMPAVLAVTYVAGAMWHGQTLTWVDRAIQCLPFVIAAMWARRYFEAINRVPRWMAAVLAVASGAAIWPVTSSSHYQDPWLVVPLGLAGTLMLLMLAQVLSRSWMAHRFAWAGAASMGVFLVSPYFQGATRVALQRMHLTEPWTQLLVTTVVATALAGLTYQYRVRLRIGWTFVWPFGRLRRGQPSAPAAV